METRLANAFVLGLSLLFLTMAFQTTTAACYFKTTTFCTTVIDMFGNKLTQFILLLIIIGAAMTILYSGYLIIFNKGEQ